MKKKIVKNLVYISVIGFGGIFGLGKVYGRDLENQKSVEEVVDYGSLGADEIRQEIKRLKGVNNCLRGGVDYLPKSIRFIDDFYKVFVESILDPLLPGEQTLDEERRALEVVEKINENNDKIEQLEKMVFQKDMLCDF
jgi:hypothetical protein